MAVVDQPWVVKNYQILEVDIHSVWDNLHLHPERRIHNIFLDPSKTFDPVVCFGGVQKTGFSKQKGVGVYVMMLCAPQTNLNSEKEEGTYL